MRNFCGSFDTNRYGPLVLGSYIILDPVSVSPDPLMAEWSPTSNNASIQNLTMGSKLIVQFRFDSCKLDDSTCQLAECERFDCSLAFEVRPFT
jgi:hypothetical protein